MRILGRICNVLCMIWVIITFVVAGAGCTNKEIETPKPAKMELNGTKWTEESASHMVALEFKDEARAVLASEGMGGNWSLEATYTAEDGKVSLFVDNKLSMDGEITGDKMQLSSPDGYTNYVLTKKQEE